MAIGQHLATSDVVCINLNHEKSAFNLHVRSSAGLVKPVNSRSSTAGNQAKGSAGSTGSTPITRKKSVGFAHPVVNGIREVRCVYIQLLPCRCCLAAAWNRAACTMHLCLLSFGWQRPGKAKHPAGGVDFELYVSLRLCVNAGYARRVR